MRRPAAHRACTRRLTSRRGRLVGALSAFAVLATAAPVFVLTSSAATATEAADPCSGQFAPVLRRVDITQGSNSKPPLVRGKTSIVRAFLGTPDCAPPGSVRLRAAAIRAYEGPGTSKPLTAGPVTTTPSTLGPAYPAVDVVDAPLSYENPANPMFQLREFGSTSTSSGEFVARFEIDVTYEYSFAGSPMSVTFGAAGTPEITTTVAPPSNSLTVLLVPMGDGGGVAGPPPAQQFPMTSNGGSPVNGQYADQTVQKGMQTLARHMPVADGIGDLTSSVPGLRYRLDTDGMLDLGPLGLNVLTDGRFCGTAPKSLLIFEKLAAYLAAWNKSNRTAQASRVVGVVWQQVSTGGGGCAEGYASLNGPTAWTRTFADRLPSTGLLDARGAGVSMTGPLLDMELSHTFGSVPSADTSRFVAGSHSKNVAADPDNVFATYDPTLARWLAGPLSVMRYTGESAGYTDGSKPPNPWNNDNTLLEADDYRYNQCALTPGMSTSQCRYNSSIGTVGTASAADGFVLAGSLGDTVNEDFTTYLSHGVHTSPSEEQGDYRLVQRDGSGNVIAEGGNVPVPVRFGGSIHDGVNAGVTQTIGSLSAAVPAADGVVQFELWKGQPTGACPAPPATRPPGCLYVRRSSAAPVVVSSTAFSPLARLANFTGTAEDDLGGAVSQDGGLVAWSAGGELVVQRRDPATNAPVPGAERVVVSSDGIDPSWNGDGTKLVFANSAGQLLIATLDRPGAGDPEVSSTRVVYEPTLQPPPPIGTRAARHPSFDTREDEQGEEPNAFVVAEVNGGIWRMKSNLSTTERVICDLQAYTVTLTCTPLASDGRSPSWQPGGDSVAYHDERGDLYTIPSSGGPRTLRVQGAREPSWGGDLVAYVATAGSVWVADTRTAVDGGWPLRTQLTEALDDARPWISSDDAVVALDRKPSLTSLDRDVFVGVRDHHGRITFTAETPDDPSLLRADVLLLCGEESGYNPVRVSMKPESTTSKTATFSTAYRSQGACPGGGIYAVVHNGYDAGDPVLIRPLPEGPVLPPVAPSPALGAPAPGTVYRQYDVVIATASAIEPQGTNPGGLDPIWQLTGPHTADYTPGQCLSEPQLDTGSPAAATAERLVLDPPVPGGWTPGRYELCLTVTDTTTGRSGTTSTYFWIVADPEHTGRTVRVQFAPQSLYIPSNGNDVTLTVTTEHQDLSRIDASTLHLSIVGSTVPLNSKGWTPNGDGSYTAKFDRLAVSCAVKKAGLASGYARAVLTGSGSPDATGAPSRILGWDPHYPHTFPSSSSTTCP